MISFLNKKWFPILLFISLFIIFVEGVNLFALWNVTPVIIFGLWLNYSLKKYNLIKNSIGEKRLRYTYFTGLIAIGFTVLIHFLWKFDLGEFSTGSSTSGLIFIFLPLYSLLVLGLGWVFIWLKVKTIDSQ